MVLGLIASRTETVVTSPIDAERYNEKLRLWRAALRDLFGLPSDTGMEKDDDNNPKGGAR